jgi:hypothetical protein
MFIVVYHGTIPAHGDDTISSEPDALHIKSDCAVIDKPNIIGLWHRLQFCNQFANFHLNLPTKAKW